MNDFGRIVEEQWLKSFEMRDDFFLDKWVLMPNHLHAIVTIDSPYENILSFENEYLAATEKCMMPTRAKNSISSLMAGFKSITVSKIDDYIDEKRMSVQKFNRRNRLWHINYNDRVIRNSEDFNNIRRYIEANPAKWKDGKFPPERFG